MRLWILILAVTAMALSLFSLPIWPIAAETQTPTWAFTGSMSVPRGGHTVTALSDGKVAAVGGWSSFDFVLPQGIEIYDAATGSFSLRGSLNTPRFWHTTTRLTNGRLLIAGGDSPGILSSAELYDPSSAQTTSTGPMLAPRVAHTATLLPDGKVLIAGGPSDITAELYDPTGNTFSAAGPMEAIRTWHTATLLTDGRVLIVGNSTFGQGATTEIYDSLTNTFSRSGDLNSGRFQHTATLLPDGKVLITGGFSSDGLQPPLASAELFDPSTGSFTVVPSPMSERRADHSAVSLPSGDVLLVGGVKSNGFFFNCTRTVDVYHNGVFSPTVELTEQAFTAERRLVLLTNGSVLAVGGTCLVSSGSSNTAEIYTPMTPENGTLTARVFSDDNENSTQDNGESALSRWNVALYQGNGCDGVPISSTSTDANGDAKFDNLIAGTWSLKEILQPGWTNTTQSPPQYCHSTSIEAGASKTIKFGNLPPPRKVVVFIQGICSELDTNVLPGGYETTFDGIKMMLKTQYGFSVKDFLEYSYMGGIVQNGEWVPTGYADVEPGSQSIFTTSAEALHNLIADYQAAHSNVSFVLVGHSLGGLVALQELLQVLDGEDSPGTVASIVTLDSPLNGLSHDILATITALLPDCFIAPNSFAALEVSALAASPPSIQEGLVKLAQTKQVNVVTLGNQDDCLYRPRSCRLPGKNEASTQIIQAAVGNNLYALGEGSSIFDFATHQEILDHPTTISAVGCVIGPQLPAPQPSPASIKACLKK